MEKKNSSEAKDLKDEDSKAKAKNDTKEEIADDFVIKRTKENKRSYVSYERRVLLYFIVVLGCLVLAASFLVKSFSTDSKEHITSKENSYIDYKVYLKKNDFYETKYLEKDMLYVASLILKKKVILISHMI